MFAALEGLTRRLLGDLANTIPMRLRPHLVRGDDATAREVYRDIVGRAIKGVRSQITRSIRAALANPSDNPPAVGEDPPSVDRTRAQAISPGLRRALESALHDAAGGIVSSAVTATARHAAGRPFSDEVFDSVRDLQPDIERDALDTARLKLRAALDRTIREHERQPPTPSTSEERAT